jgi:HEAT repeat protein
MKGHGHLAQRTIRQSKSSDAPRLGGEKALITGQEPRLDFATTLALALDLLRQSENRAQAVAVLIRLGDAAVPALLNLLHDDDPPVRHAAAWALGRLRDRASARALIHAAEWTTAFVQAPGDASAVTVLLDALRVGSRPTRVAVIIALGRLGNARALPDLFEQLGSQYQLSRVAAIWALSRIGDRRAIPYLADILDDPDRLLRDCAAAGLEAIEERAQHPPAC